MTSESSKKSFSILIVDDEARNIQLLGSLLKENGYDVEFAMDGSSAISWAKTRPFDLVLLDIMMPGMSGYEVCEKIKSDRLINHIPIIFLTAKTEVDDIVKGFEIGGADYITKPFKTPELLARVKIHAEVKTLRGLIPICTECKNVRNDEGVWERIEAYIQSRSPALFSHGLCPGCANDLYGKEPWFRKIVKDGS